MYNPKFYLDTIIPSYVFNTHVPDKQEAAKRLLDFAKTEGHEVFISAVVIREIQETQDIALRNKIAEIVKNFNVLEITEECINLAEEYIKKEIMPAKNRDDALHIACASIYEIDYLVSYNLSIL
ncbi:MAG: PIN domain-containing protein [Candidatus Omnitrophica bacterium]|nr:PIN domain-containing protein [Candidatus Omnitrophota bacterium]